MACLVLVVYKPLKYSTFKFLEYSMLINSDFLKFNHQYTVGSRNSFLIFKYYWFVICKVVYISTFSSFNWNQI